VRFKQKQDPKEGEKEGRWMDGEALRVEIDERKQTIELIDNARVNRGGDEVAGAYIFVDQRSDFFQVTTGKGEKEGQTPGRVTAKLAPTKPREDAKK
jgi:lipopolysaccharide export system protein LptA